MNACRKIFVLREASDRERFTEWQCIPSDWGSPRDSCNDYTERGWIDLRDAWPREGVYIQFDVHPVFRGDGEIFVGYRKGKMFFNRLGELTEFFLMSHVTKWSYLLPR